MLGFIHKAENLQITDYCTVGENIIATTKMRNNFCYSLKKVILLYCSPFSYRSSNFAIAKVVAPNIFVSNFVKVLWISSLLFFCIVSHIVITPPTIATALKDVALSPFKARKSDNYRCRDSWKSDNFRERAIERKAKR